MKLNRRSAGNPNPLKHKLHCSELPHHAVGPTEGRTPPPLGGLVSTGHKVLTRPPPNLPTERRCVREHIERGAQHRTAGVTICGPEIQNAASRFAESLGIKNFEASEGWVARFKGRHNIVKRKIVGEKLSADESSVEPFKRKLREYIVANNIYSYQIYNADETGLYWRSLPEKTLAMRSEGCVPGRKVCKDRLSAMMCANADGTDRITCAIVGKSKKPRALQHCMDRLPVKYYDSKNAWFTQEIFLSWFHDVFCREVGACQIKKLKIRPSEVRALLLLDNAPAHPRINTLTSHDGKITCMALPPNTTSLIQPMDQGVICATKRLYTKKMLNEVLVVLPLPEDIELGVDNRAKKTLQNLKNNTIKEAIYNWAKVWSELKESTLKNSWKKLLTSTVKNDEEMDFEGFTDEIHGMFRNAGENLERQDVVDWLEQDANDPGYGVMSEDEILQSVTGEVDKEDEEGSEEPTPMTTKYSTLMTYVDRLINFSSNCAHPEVGNMYPYLRRTKELIIQLASEHRSIKIVGNG
ncbi:tigger transposable element-derived protein 7-like [Procambarus clarkii]|uniref:tigger transposable element-derived protein 7-like n=1 Tax=Procambarus clarkii TaxID=6728 RepID=UPI003743817E